MLTAARQQLAMTIALCRSNSSIPSKLDASSRTDPGSGTTASGLPAVAQGRVYLAPALPFGWIDEPPSVNRLLGLLWAGHTLYPAVYPEDLRAEARDFYRRFYRIELDDEQFEALSQ